MTRCNGRFDELALMHVHEHGCVWPMRDMAFYVADDRVGIDALELNLFNLNRCSIGLGSWLAVFQNRHRHMAICIFGFYRCAG